MEETLVSQLITDVRQVTDIETSSPSVDFITDAMLTRWIEQAYRELVDLIIDNGKEEAIDLLAVSTTLTSPFNVPANFYRAVAVDADVFGFQRQLKPSSWRARAAHNAMTLEAPRYKLIGGSVQFFPADNAPTSCTLWYIPTIPASDGSLVTFNGWDEFLLNAVALKVCAKEERDASPFMAARQAAMARIITACKALSVATSETIIPTACYPADWE